MTGDPLRAKYVAETKLDNVRQVTGVRNMFGFTGTWQARKSASWPREWCTLHGYLFLRNSSPSTTSNASSGIGTCGGMIADIDVGDLVIAMTASTDSNYAHQYRLNGSFSPCADYGLLEKA
jgi:purine-nucleoside phosphorylase